jgi:hypothetical protein
MPQQCQRLDDDKAHERAIRHLAKVTGADRATGVRWDPQHHLQGHVDVGGQHLVVIAARDEDHAPLVLSESDWDALRHGGVTA